jgi:hypothetical protein
LVIELANPKGADPKRKPSRSVIEVPWHKTPSTRRREVLIPEAGPPPDTRPIRSENRAILVASIARGRRWLDELIADPAATTESIAGRESCTTRKINRTISLAFLAPELVKAPIDGRLPDGMGVARLADLSAEWSRQRRMLGLPVLKPFQLRPRIRRLNRVRFGESDLGRATEAYPLRLVPKRRSVRPAPSPVPAQAFFQAQAQVRVRVREYRRGSVRSRGCRLVSNRADALSCRFLLQ